jgi:hypothetical protein
MASLDLSDCCWRTLDVMPDVKVMPVSRRFEAEPQGLG